MTLDLKQESSQAQLTCPTYHDTIELDFQKLLHCIQFDRSHNQLNLENPQRKLTLNVNWV